MKTFNKTLAIGAAFTAAVILAPVAFAQGPHGGPPPSNGIQLATDIVNLVRAVIEPRPAPVVVAPSERIVTTNVVTTTPIVTTTPVVTTTPIVTTTPVVTTIPEYSYSYFYGEYVPYYEGWYYYSNDWIWGGLGPRPLAPPRWRPPHHNPPRPVIVYPDNRPPARRVDPAPARRIDPAPRTTTARPQERKSSAIPVAPSQHRVPRANASSSPRTTAGKNSSIPVAPSQHRVPRKNDR